MIKRKTVHTGCLLVTITSDGDMEDVFVEWDKDVPANIACEILDSLRECMDNSAWIVNHVNSARRQEDEEDNETTDDTSRAGLFDLAEKPKGSKAH
jgi:hypothetical protein